MPTVNGVLPTIISSVFIVGADDFSELQVEWLKANPCPLPSPVKVLTPISFDEYCIENNYPIVKVDKSGFNTKHYTYYLKYINGYNACLSDLGLK